MKWNQFGRTKEAARMSALREVALIEAELARRALLNFACYTKRDYKPNWHHGVLAKALDQALAGEVQHVMVFMPPQHGKSELISRRFPAYALGRKPDTRIVAWTYNSDWATALGRDVQKVMGSAEYRTLFHGVRLAAASDIERRTAGEFDVVGHEGGYKSSGVGGGIAGRPMTLGLVDDPHKNREEAESQTVRASVIRSFESDFMARRSHDRVPIVLTQTRWHEGDLAGYLLEKAKSDPKAHQWAVISIPAICEREQPFDPRAIGDPIWPERFGLDGLRAIEATNAYDWSSLYQQRPTPSGGAVFKREWFRRYEILAPGNVLRRCRCWDIAGTLPRPGVDPDYTVGTLLAELVGGLWMVEHVVRGRWTANEVDNLIYQTAVADGRKTIVRELREGGSSGKAVIASHTRMLAGWDFAERLTPKAKVEEWRPFARQVEAGNVVLPMGTVPWLRAWLDEITQVPHLIHDDQADSVAGAFNALTEHVPKKKGAASVSPSGPALMPGVSGGPAVGVRR